MANKLWTRYLQTLLNNCGCVNNTGAIDLPRFLNVRLFTLTEGQDDADHHNFILWSQPSAFHSGFWSDSIFFFSSILRHTLQGEHSHYRLLSPWTGCVMKWMQKAGANRPCGLRSQGRRYNKHWLWSPLLLRVFSIYTLNPIKAK